MFFIYYFFVFELFSFQVTSDSAQDSLLALCSVITPGDAQENISGSGYGTPLACCHLFGGKGRCFVFGFSGSYTISSCAEGLALCSEVTYVLFKGPLVPGFDPEWTGSAARTSTSCTT